jgi:NAD(P)-dependent dehydrogenase (short-subunit alcohol dehydrogenase family)
MHNRPVALITGASRGIGEAAAFAFARAGYDCALLADDHAGLLGVSRALQQQDAAGLVLSGDLSNLDFAQNAVEQTVERFGRIDVLVNNAAWRDLVTMRKIERDSWEKTLRICLTAPAFLAKWCAAHMEKGGGGVILNVSSIQSRFPGGISPAYTAAKGGLDALTYELATLYGPAGIRVLSVNPGAIDTALSRNYAPGDFDRRLRAHVEDMIPLGRFGRAEEVASMLVMLAGNAASYLTGTCIDIDGGWFHQCSPYSLKHLQFPREFLQAGENTPDA